MKKIILIIAVFLLTGCYDYNELDELKIVSALFIDYKNDEYVVNVEVLNTNKEKEKPTYFLEGTGKTFEEGLNDIYLKSTYQLYFSQMYSTVLSESVAKDKLKYMYDFFTRDTDIRKDFYVFITEDIDELLKFESEEKMSVGETLKTDFEYSEKKNAKYRTSNFRQILNSYLNEKNYFLGSVQLKNNTIELKDTFLIHNNKLNQKIDEKAVLLINLLDSTESSFQIFDKNTYEVFEYAIEQSVKKGKINLDFKGTVRLLNMGNIPSENVEDVKKIETGLNETFKKYFSDCIEYSKNIGYDIYNFNYYYHLYYPNAEKGIWKNLDYSVNTRIKINEKGLIIDSLGDGLDEK